MRSPVEWSSAQLVFIHVPKAAGTSFVRALEVNFRREEICPAYYWAELFRIPRARLLRYRLIRGHFDYCVVELLRDVRVITMLREPVARAASYYRYIRSNEQHPLCETFRRRSFLEVLEHPELGIPIRDAQTRLFGRDIDLELLRRKKAPEAPPVYPWENRPGGSRLSLDRALERVARMDFVGVQERFDDALLLLAYTLGWPPPERIERVNVTPAGEADPARDPEVAARVRECNRLDERLYRHAAALFEERFEAMRGEVAAALGVPRERVGREEIVSALRQRAEAFRRAR